MANLICLLRQGRNSERLRLCEWTCDSRDPLDLTPYRPEVGMTAPWAADGNPAMIKHAAHLTD